MPPLAFRATRSAVPFAVTVFRRGGDLGTSVRGLLGGFSFAAAFLSAFDGTDRRGTSINPVIVELRVSDKPGQSSRKASVQYSFGRGGDIDFHVFVPRLWAFRT